MKLIHLSDLHLGKRVNEFSMLPDQRYILAQILGIIKKEGADAVLLAGDLYDKQIPAAETVQLLDWFLTELAGEGITVLAVSGNHDSPERMAFGSRLMSGRGVYVSPVYDGRLSPVILEDAWGEAAFYLLPFLKPATVRHALEIEEIGDFNDAVRLALERVEVDTRRRNILVAHQYVTGASRCESEEILVGGMDNVDASVFDRFDYVALGHIHSPQKIGRETVRYCGTPLKYSFSEAEQEKSLTVVELGPKGTVNVRTVPLTPLRDLRRIRGTYMEVTARSFYKDMNTEDYLSVTLTDEEDIPDGIQRLRVIYPNLMRLEYDNRRTRENSSVGMAEAVERRTEMELLEEFYEKQNHSPMSKEQRALAVNMLQEIKERAQ